jgi:hypothetical protein
MTAPERIRAAWHDYDDIDTPKSLTALTPASRFFDTDPHLVEFIRADLHDATKAQLATAVGALQEWDALIKHQYSGSRDAMSDMTYAAQHTAAVLAEIEKGGV